MKKKIVIFGAGKIGRSFIGQLFSRGGYEVVFIDVNNELVKGLNEKRQYKVVIKKPEGNEAIDVKNVRAVHGTEKQKVSSEVSDSELVAVSVGQSGLSHILPLIANGLLIRQKKHPGQPLDIIIAENMRNADLYLKTEMRKILGDNCNLLNTVGFVETSIGKMVPIMTNADLKEDPLQVFSEAYNTLILDKKGFKNAIPDVPELAPKENMKAWVDRKLFIHNFGHAATAYLGYAKNSGWKYIYEVLDDLSIKQFVYEAMQQSAKVLKTMYPGEFTEKQLTDHIADLLKRFANKALGDTIFRVGCDLQRKLGPDDRVVGIIKNAQNFDLPFDKVAKVLEAAFQFKATDENGKMFTRDIAFHKQLDKGKDFVLKDFCELYSITV
jgi:mannitol-1-phosphate 5-dehydrogenase